MRRIREELDELVVGAEDGQVERAVLDRVLVSAKENPAAHVGDDERVEIGCAGRAVRRVQVLPARPLERDEDDLVSAATSTLQLDPRAGR
jgi:hypothetical protein